MSGIDLLDLRMGDVLRLRKAHPCGSHEWEIVRLGGDVGLRCRGCSHRIIMDRPTLRRRAMTFVERGAPLDPAVEQALYGTPPVPNDRNPQQAE